MSETREQIEWLWARAERLAHALHEEASRPVAPGAMAIQLLRCRQTTEAAVWKIQVVPEPCKGFDAALESYVDRADGYSSEGAALRALLTVLRRKFAPYQQALLDRYGALQSLVDALDPSLDDESPEPPATPVAAERAAQDQAAAPPRSTQPSLAVQKTFRRKPDGKVVKEDQGKLAAAICTLVAHGVSNNGISRTLGISRATTAHWLKKLSLRVPTTRGPAPAPAPSYRRKHDRLVHPADIPKIRTYAREMLGRGVTMAAIAGELGLSRDTIRGYLRKNKTRSERASDARS